MFPNVLLFQSNFNYYVRTKPCDFTSYHRTGLDVRRYNERKNSFFSVDNRVLEFHLMLRLKWTVTDLLFNNRTCYSSRPAQRLTTLRSVIMFNKTHLRTSRKFERACACVCESASESVRARECVSEREREREREREDACESVRWGDL